MLRDQLRAIIATWIDDGLKARGWGPTDLERESGITREQVWRLRERAADATDDTLTALAKALRIPLPVLTIRDDQGRSDYRMGVRDALRAVRAKIKEVEVTPPVGDGSDDGHTQNADQARRQAAAGQHPVPPARPRRKSG